MNNLGFSDGRFVVNGLSMPAALPCSPSIEQLLEQCQLKLPGFRISLQVVGKGIPVMAQWGYDFRAPIMDWQRSRATEMGMGGVYPSIRECLMAVLARCGRFEIWVGEQQKQAEFLEAKIRANRAAVATPVEKPEADEGDEPPAPTEPLPEITPLPDELDVGKLAST